MGSSTVQHLATDGHIHVAFDRSSRMWWAVGRPGSYGGDRSHAKVVRLAAESAATAGHGMRVVLHNTKGRVVGTRAPADRPSPQWSQDSVP